jgi:hypothetical protein
MNSLPLRLAVGLAALACAVAGAACSGSRGAGTASPSAVAASPTTAPATATSPAPASTATPPSTPAPTPEPAADRRTGVPDLDRIIDAVDQKDVATLEQLVDYQVVGCTTELGAGGPPKCPNGVADGTMLRVFPVVSCEGGWTEDASETLAFFVDAARGLYAAARNPGIPDVGPDWPASDTLLVFHLQQPYGAAAGRIHVSAGRIVAVWYSCSVGSPPSILLDVAGHTAPLIAGPWDQPVRP